MVSLAGAHVNGSRFARTKKRVSRRAEEKCSMGRKLGFVELGFALVGGEGTGFVGVCQFLSFSRFRRFMSVFLGFYRLVGLVVI